MAEAISPAALQQLMASDELHAVIDVRATEDYRAGQIFRSTSVPFDELDARLGALVPVSSVPTVALAGDDRASAEAAAQCERIGLTNVRWIAGGLRRLVGGRTAHDRGLERPREGLRRTPARPAAGA